MNMPTVPRCACAYTRACALHLDGWCAMRRGPCPVAAPRARLASRMHPASGLYGTLPYLEYRCPIVSVSIGELAAFARRPDAAQLEPLCHAPSALDLDRIIRATRRASAEAR